MTTPRVTVPVEDLSMPTVDLSDDSLVKVASGEIITWGEAVRRLSAAPAPEGGAADLHAIAKDAAERVHKNGGCVPQMAFAPILFALQEALRAQPQARAWGWDYEICTGCSASLTMADIKAGGQASCCPERRMVTVRDLVDAYDAQRKPPSREDAQPVYALEVVRDPTVEGAKRFVGVTHPAPDALRVALTDLIENAVAARGCGLKNDPDGIVSSALFDTIMNARQALAALQAEQGAK